jgi:hypothetical protein
MKYTHNTMALAGESSDDGEREGVEGRGTPGVGDAMA